MKTLQSVKRAGAADIVPTAGDLGPLKSYIGFALRRAQDASFQAFARRVGEANLSPGHFAILKVIHERPGISQTQLSYAAGRDKSTLTPTLKELERRGFVRRERLETDRRIYMLYLLEAGEAQLLKLSIHAQDHDRMLDRIVGQHNKSLLLHLLDRIAEELSQDVRPTETKSPGA